MELEEVTKKILEARQLIRVHENDPDALSKLALRMSTYNTYLGDYSSQAYLDTSKKKVAKYLELKQEGMKSTPADTEAKYHVKVDEANADTLNKLHKDSASLVSTIQTRLRVLENQLKNEI